MLTNVKFSSFIDNLLLELNNGLPGENAQFKMAPLHRKKSEFDGTKSLSPKPSSVFILLYPHHQNVYFVLTLRTDYGGVHSNQVSFPGGKFEQRDGDLLNTALRETYEEIGVEISQIKTLGKLTDLYIPPSNFLVSPYVGYCNERPEFKIDDREVSALLEIPITALLDEQSMQCKSISTSSGFNFDAPCFLFHNKVVWGATAMMLSEFKELLKRFS